VAKSGVLPSWWKLNKIGKKQEVLLVSNPRPGPDGPNASGWYRRFRMQKLTLLVFIYVKLPVQSFQLWHFVDKDCFLPLTFVYYCQPQKRPEKKSYFEHCVILPPTAIFGTKNWYNLGLLPTPRSPQQDRNRKTLLRNIWGFWRIYGGLCRVHKILYGIHWLFCGIYGLFCAIQGTQSRTGGSFKKKLIGKFQKQIDSTKRMRGWPGSPKKENWQSLKAVTIFTRAKIGGKILIVGQRVISKKHWYEIKKAGVTRPKRKKWSQVKGAGVISLLVSPWQTLSVPSFLSILGSATPT